VPFRESRSSSHHAPSRRVIRACSSEIAESATEITLVVARPREVTGISGWDCFVVSSTISPAGFVVSDMSLRADLMSCHSTNKISPMNAYSRMGDIVRSAR